MGFTEQEIANMISRSEETSTDVMSNIKPKKSKNIRNLLIVGCGDGGCSIASDIGKHIDEAYVIAYNTSERTINDIKSDRRILVEGEDGSGKVRAYSKDLFKEGAYKHLLDSVQNCLEKTEYEYILVCSTADGGTGSGMSVMAAKMLADNVDTPVVILGVYPSLRDDSTAQWNAMQWQVEVTKSGLPYLIFDNNMNATKKVVHEAVNTYITNVMRLISGNMYGDHVVSIIDNRDLYMLIQHIGGRIVVGTSTTRPTIDETLDDYIDKMIEESHQPAPTNIGGIGIFLKGPKELIDKFDPSIHKIRNKYGEASVHYLHIEYADDVNISFVFSGNDEPSERLFIMKDRYDYLMSTLKSKNIFSDVMADQMTNPLGDIKQKKVSGDIDLSALDM